MRVGGRTVTTLLFDTIINRMKIQTNWFYLCIFKIYVPIAGIAICELAKKKMQNLQSR